MPQPPTDVRRGGISGGQRKRLTTAEIVIARPPPRPLPQHNIIRSNIPLFKYSPD